MGSILFVGLVWSIACACDSQNKMGSGSDSGGSEPAGADDTGAVLDSGGEPTGADDTGDVFDSGSESSDAVDSGWGLDEDALALPDEGGAEGDCS